MLFRSAFLISSAGLAVAYSISSNCTSALLAVAASPNATCLDLAPLASVLISPNTSVISTVNNWLTGLCNRAPCSNATLQAVVANITTGCSSDLSSIGLNISGHSSVVTTIQAAYPVVRQIACLKDTSANTLCATESLTTLQSAIASLSFSNIIGLLTQGALGKHFSFPKNATCSNCSKATFAILSKDFPAFLPGDAATFRAQCGSSFTDGQIPSDIQETATNSTTNSTSNSTPSSTPTSGGASISVSSFVSVTMLITVSSVFLKQIGPSWR